VIADSTFPKFARIQQFIYLVFSTFLITGCAGIVMVDYAIDARVSGIEAQGGTWIAKPEQIVNLPRPEGLLSPFDATQFKSERFSWTFGTSTLGFGGSFANHSNRTLCLHFDEARLSSNLRSDSVPLRTFSTRYVQSSDRIMRTTGSTDPRKRELTAPPTMCIPPLKSALISIGPDLSNVFPTGLMFNVRLPDTGIELVDKGVGNWMNLSLPIEFDGKREMIEVKLTARDSKARVTYY
jgi:hypothetical protein